MDKLNLVKDGVIRKLPPGFRFQPTDEEIVFQYLARKIFSYPLPATIIPEINIFSFDPWDLPQGESDQDRYFFSHKTNYQDGNRVIIGSTCAGYWKTIGSDKRIICPKTMALIGSRKTLIFYKRKNHRITRTDWIMHEYCIALTGSTTACSVQQKRNPSGSLIQIGNWVLCHIFLKKRRAKSDDDEEDVWPNNYDRMTEDISDADSSSASSSSSSYSDSSILTEVEVNSSIANDETSNENI